MNPTTLRSQLHRFRRGELDVSEMMAMCDGMTELLEETERALTIERERVCRLINEERAHFARMGGLSVVIKIALGYGSAAALGALFGAMFLATTWPGAIVGASIGIFIDLIIGRTSNA